jgi:hypothetical protein
MKIAAGIIGLIIGFLSLVYVGVLGNALGSFVGFTAGIGSPDPGAAAWASTVKTLSWLAPLALLVGGAITFKDPFRGAIVLAIGAALHWYLMGFGSFGNIIVLPAAVASGLALFASFSKPDTPKPIP